MSDTYTVIDTCWIFQGNPFKWINQGLNIQVDIKSSRWSHQTIVVQASVLWVSGRKWSALQGIWIGMTFFGTHPAIYCEAFSGNMTPMQQTCRSWSHKTFLPSNTWLQHFACHSLAIAMTGQDLQKLLPGETLDFHVWSSPKNIPAYDYDFWSSKDYDGYRQRNMTVHLDKKIDNNKDMLKAWAHMARADILIMSQSSFSMVPALLGLVVWVHLWVTLWQEFLVPQPEWFSNSVSFSAKEIQLKILPGPTLMNTLW